MARYVADQNSSAFQYESGTYASASGTNQSIGLTQETSVEEQTNMIDIRFQNSASRNVSTFQKGVLDYDISVPFYPQDWKTLAFALGSCVDAGSPSPYTHVISEVNSASGNAFTSGTKLPFMSFTYQQAAKGASTGENSILTVQGAVIDEWNMTISPGEPVSVEVTAFGQSGTFTSGAISLPSVSSMRPYMFDDFVVHIPSGTLIDTTKEIGVNIKNNFARDDAHYLNGSRVMDIPAPLNRDYEVSLTIDASSEFRKTLHESYLLPGSSFNMMIFGNAKDAGAGSRDVAFIFSGCVLKSMPNANKTEGVDEDELTISPQSLIVNVNDTIEKYNPW